MAVLHRESPFLAAAIASLAAVYDATSEAESYTERAAALGRSLSDQPSLTTVQGFLVLAVRQLVAWRDLKAWMHAGTAIRMAQALQLGREDANQMRFTPRQRETRRRTFWACFVVDRLISYACHHRFALDLSSSMTPLARLPCSDSAFAFDEPDTGPTMDEILAVDVDVDVDMSLTAQTGAPRSLSRLSIAPFYIAMARLWGDMALLHITGGRRHMVHLPTDPASPFFQASRAIAGFMDQLPPALAWSAANYRLHQMTGQAAAFVHFNLLLHHARCVMHHEYLPQLDMQYYAPLDELAALDAAGLPPNYIHKPLIDTCIHAIDTITDMVAVLSRDDTASACLQTTVAANALMTAAAVHLWIVYTQTCDRCPKHVARANFRRLLAVIASWEAQWPVAAAWAQTLGMLSKLYEFSYGTEPVPEFISWEVDDEPAGAEAGAENDAAASESGLSYDADPESVGQCLHDKVRGILAHPLHPPDVKRRMLRVFSQALWQNLWGSTLFGELGACGLDIDNYMV